MINCSICNKKTVAFKGSIASKSGLCFACWEKTYCVVWVSEFGKTSMPKEQYDKNPQKWDEIYKGMLKQ